jgi:type VI protein secretion system component Hcp
MSVRRAARRAVVACAALGVAAGAYAVGAGHSGSSTAAPLGPGGLLLAAANADGVTVNLTITSASGTSIANAPADSVQWGVGASVTQARGIPREKSEPSISDITLARPIDSSTPTLIQLTEDSSATNLIAVVTVTRPDKKGAPAEQLTFRASEAALTGDSESVGAGSDQLGHESVSISPGDLTVTYTGAAGPSVIAHVGGAQKGSTDSQAKLRQVQARAQND